MRALALGLGFIATGCFFPAERGKLLEARVDKLTDENRKLAEQIKSQQAQLQGGLDKIEKAVESMDRASRRTDADIGVQMQKTVEDVAGLRGQVETFAYKVSDLESQFKAAKDDIDRKSVDPETAKAMEAKKKADEVKRPDNPGEFLKLALDKAKAGEASLAKSLFNEFIKKWPKDVGAAEAHFALGEAQFEEDRCREALYEYGRVIQEFAKSAVAPMAYLRSGECFKRLKMFDEAKLALEELQKSYPKSEAAKLGKSKAAELEKERAPKKAPKK